MDRRKRSKYDYHQIGMILMMVFFLAGSSFHVEAADSVHKKEINSCSDVAGLIADTWDDNYFGKIVVDPETGTVKKDGKPSDFSREFDVKSSEKSAGIKSEDSAGQYLEEEDMIYEVETNEDGEIEITAPFQTRRLIVEQELSDSYGADTMYYDEEEQETILQFDTQEKTRDAYEEICRSFGTETCFPDEVYFIDDILMDTVDQSGVFTSWGTRYMGMDSLKGRAASKGYSSPVTVAVLDTGIDSSNALFAFRTVSPKSYNIAGNSYNVMDTHGHGTHVSGIIADATPSNVQILMLKISNSEGYSSLLTIRTALRYAVKQKADVINMSVGFISVQADKCDYLDSIINKAYAKGIPIVAAAGNNAVNVNYCYPACNKKTIAISSLNESGQLAYYSNRGSGIDFCAPGSNIVSARPGGGLVSMSGTSMAAPHITASIAYLKMMQKNLSVSGVYQELKLRCKDLGKAGKDSDYGWGCPIMSGLFDTGIVNRTQIVGAPVTKLKSVKNTEKGVSLSWKKIAGVTNYVIYRKAGNGSYKKLVTVSSKKTTYIDKTAKQGKKYTYGIKTIKSKKKSGLSNTKQIVRLKTVSKTSAKAGKGKKITFTWKKQKGVTGYQVRFSQRKNWKNSQTIIVTNNIRKLTQKGLSRSVYYYKIRSYRKIGTKVSYSTWSAVKKVKVR